MAQIIICAGIAIVPYIRPVGAYQLANVLRSEGYTVQVIDQFPWVAYLGKETILQLFDKFVGPETLWIGYSSTWFKRITEMRPGHNDHTPGGLYNNVEEIRANTKLLPEPELVEIKQFVLNKNPNVKFVLGGARAPLGRGGKFSNSKFIDYFIEGYADTAVLKFSKWCLNNSSEIKMSENPDGSFTISDDIKAAEFDYNNFKFTWAREDLVNYGESLPMEIARGCIFSCAFCAYPLNGRKKMDYLKNPEILRQQFVENYEKYGTIHYFFLDDTFNDSIDKLRILQDECFSKLNFQPRFSAFMRLDLIAAHPESIELLKNIGVESASFGIESMNYEANKTIGKGIGKTKIIETLHQLREEWPKDVILEAQFIMGLPNETEETITEWLDELLDPEFPLDSAKIEPLWLSDLNASGMRNKLWKSKFELDPEKYGYTFPNPTVPTYWVNNKGFSLQDAEELKKSYGTRWKIKERPGWVGDRGVVNIGVPEDEIKSRRENNFSIPVGKADHFKRLNFVENYVKRLLEL